MRLSRFLPAFYSSCLILFLCLPLDELHAQTGGKQSVAASVQCSIEIETETWSSGEPIFVAVQLKNISDKDADLLGIYTFELRGAQPAHYWSPVNILSGAPLELEAERGSQEKGTVGGRVTKGAIHLEPGETKAMKFNLSKLLWNESFSSVWPHRKLFEIVPKGNYDLTFNVETDRRKNSNVPDVTHVASNSVRIVVE